MDDNNNRKDQTIFFFFLFLQSSNQVPQSRIPNSYHTQNFTSYHRRAVPCIRRLQEREADENPKPWLREWSVRAHCRRRARRHFFSANGAPLANQALSGGRREARRTERPKPEARRAAALPREQAGFRRYSARVNGGANSALLLSGVHAQQDAVGVDLPVHALRNRRTRRYVVALERRLDPRTRRSLTPCRPTPSPRRQARSGRGST
jgi:hypothetical protein